MRGKRRTWSVRLAASAEKDFDNILEWTAAKFGQRQARAYARILAEAIAALSGGPAILAAKPRDDIAAGLHTLHVARTGRKGRHFILFRVSTDDRGLAFVDVLRILHDAMDLARHSPASNPDWNGQ